jgi:probable phosphoglycerate mutase
MQTTPQTTRVILVRHGQSTYNAQGRYQGCSDDAVLTEKGRWMASCTGQALSHLAIDTLYTSPLQRTQETAALILSALETAKKPLPSLLVHPCLKEISLPAWEGLPFKTVRQTFAADYQSWREHPHQFQIAPQTALASHGVTATLTQPCFPVQDLYAQARRFWQDLLPCYRGKTVLIVSHGGTIRALIGTALHLSHNRSPETLPPEAYFHTLQQSNGGISLLTFSGNAHQPVRLEAMNLTQHLGETLPKLKEGKTGLRLLLMPTPTTSNSRTQPPNIPSFLNQIPLDFCLSDRSSESAIATFQTLLSHYDFSADCLSTGLAIIDSIKIQSFLNSMLGLPSSACCLSIQPGCVSVVHYPTATKHPVIQALNCSDLSFSFQGDKE